MEKVDSGKFKGYDFSDASIIVECVYAQGYVCHCHVSPAFLEKYEPQKEDDDFELLMMASDLLRGEGGLGTFLCAYDSYKEKCQKRNEKNES